MKEKLAIAWCEAMEPFIEPFIRVARYGAGGSRRLMEQVLPGLSPLVVSVGSLPREMLPGRLWRGRMARGTNEPIPRVLGAMGMGR